MCNIHFQDLGVRQYFKAEVMITAHNREKDHLCRTTTLQYKNHSGSITKAY